jgi:hypothetical protein
MPLILDFRIRPTFALRNREAPEGHHHRTVIKVNSILLHSCSFQSPVPPIFHLLHSLLEAQPRPLVTTSSHSFTMHRVILYASVLAGLAIAAPHAQPQEIDLSGVIAAGGPEIVTPPADVVSEVVTLPSTSSIAPITTDPAKLRKRIVERDACQPEPAGSGPLVSPDTPEAFIADPTLQVSPL